MSTADSTLRLDITVANRGLRMQVREEDLELCRRALGAYSAATDYGAEISTACTRHPAGWSFQNESCWIALVGTATFTAADPLFKGSHLRRPERESDCTKRVEYRRLRARGNAQDEEVARSCERGVTDAALLIARAAQQCIDVVCLR